MAENRPFFAHETAVIDAGSRIGDGSKIWHFSHIMRDCVIGERCNIGQNVVISPQCRIGNNVKIQNNVSVYTGVILEDDVFCGPSMVFTNVVNPRSHIERKTEYRQTLVRRGASIGANSTIICGVTLGQYCFVGAGAVVTRDVPDYAIVYGNPARLKGWACYCGVGLEFGDAAESSCPDCDRKYSRQGNVVVQLQIPRRTLMRPQPVSAAARMQVPLLDLKGQYQALKSEILPVIEKVCASQNFILGPYVKELEQRVAAYSQAAHAIGLSSGTDALLIALMALDVGAGDEVITTPYAFFATGGTVARVGARPIYCDIEPRSYNLSAVAVRNFIDTECDLRDGKLRNRRTGGHVKVLMPVHLYGQVADMKPLMDIARSHGLKVVEDAAQAIGSEYTGGKRAGSIGDIGCFSFFPSKNLGAFGDAGLCTANDTELAEKLRILRVHGGKPKYYHSVIGGNFRLDELQAAVLTVKLGHLDSWTEGRQRNARFYDEAFARAGVEPKITLPKVERGQRHIFNQYIIRSGQRDQLKAHLTECGIGTEIYYPVPLHLQQCFAYLGYKAGDCPESERAAAETLALPIYPELSPEQLQYVVDTVARFVS